MYSPSLKRYSVGQLLRLALLLSIITIVYNLIEGVVSSMFGTSDETLALLGFGADSFVEVISGMGIAHMVWRMQNGAITERAKFEIQALRITGFSFYLLTIALVIGSAYNIYHRIMPESTTAGIIISLISIVSMYFLYRYKVTVGLALDSKPIISDAHCTKTCFYLSFILLGSSLIYDLFKIPYVDALGSLGIAWYAFKEGKEALSKAKSKVLSHTDDCC